MYICESLNSPQGWLTSNSYREGHSKGFNIHGEQIVNIMSYIMCYDLFEEQLKQYSLLDSLVEKCHMLEGRE